jgi:aryl-alcohol dehydrogenase-like predicted oxidoreductase
MEYRVLGAAGPKVSNHGLGTSTWGTTTGLDDAREQLRMFLDTGGSLLDTADIYGGGRSEEIIGALLGEGAPREQLVLATKCVGVMGADGPAQDASRKHLLEGLDASLARLRTDYVDLWQLHAWDRATPLEETLAAVDTALASGRVRHAGVCNYAGWQTAKAAARQQDRGHAPLVSVQAEYSLLERGIEREAVAAAADAGLGILPWAPLGRGVLTAKYRDGVPAEKAANEFFRWYVSPHVNERAARIVEAVVETAEALGATPIGVSLAWLRERPGVVAPLIGARTAEQLRDSLDERSLSLVLPPELRDRLDEVSRPYVGYPEKGL